MFNSTIRKTAVVAGIVAVSSLCLSACGSASVLQDASSEVRPSVVQALEDRGFVDVTYLTTRHEYLQADLDVYNVKVGECSILVGWNDLDAKFDIAVNGSLYEKFAEKHKSALLGTEISANVITHFADDLNLTDCISGDIPA